MRIDYQITLREFVAARNYTAAHSPSLWLRMVQSGPNFVVPTLWLSLEFLFGRGHATLVLWSGVALLGAYIEYVFYRSQRAKSAYLSAQATCDIAWLEADDDGLRLPDGALPWGELRKYADLKHMFLLFRDDAQAVIVPKRGLEADQIVRFRDLLQTMAARYAVPLLTSA